MRNTVVRGESTDQYCPSREGFLYHYWCDECGRRFTETTPEVSAPALCHACATGTHHDYGPGRGKKRRGRPG